MTAFSPKSPRQRPSPSASSARRRPTFRTLAGKRVRWRLGSLSPRFIDDIRRRQGWFLDNLTIRKLFNMMVGAAGFALKRERKSAWPIALKIDISPMCNLHCTCCVHADPNGNPNLEKLEFKAAHKMSVEQYERIIDEVKGRTSAVSLYYLGDPIVHPDLDKMCGIAHDAGLNVHISTNFSVPLSDERIRSIVTSGLTHLSVCVDGLSQEKYERTRVGGRIDLVLDNLRRVCECRQELGRRYPQVEVQYIKYQHNLDELDEARQLLTAMGVDQVTDFWGALDNDTDRDPNNGNVASTGPKGNARLPQCFWPHFSMVIKWDGDVIPCCTHRQGAQHNETDDSRAFGNVFETSVRDVWNSVSMRQARRLVNNPQSIKSDASLAENFCKDCPVIFNTDTARIRRRASKHHYEELYTINVKGRPVRRPESMASPAEAVETSDT